ncbi:hypothetical protein I6F33_10730 [Bradyrhizobium sp. BRP20]|uniref:hypothetical protein n=1 Tax=Bradyrhizobium sp. BRP20 TaxID=2793822 RepID=UPI001CD407E3|nr:hypothetical protein [Bradyrhizobium sp. BRP20]MCA1433452.1 hypothetical protein [Bradyrhizobium sp. BRP20]
MSSPFQRIVLLNGLVARSISKAPSHAKVPIVSGKSMFDALEERRKAAWAIEFFGKSETERESEETDDERKIRCAGLNFIWLRDLKCHTRDGFRYYQLLLEYVDQQKTTFSVVDTANLNGRDISGHENERGCVSAHVVVRTPVVAVDSGDYRCVIEVAHSINRKMIEDFLCRQLRRWATQDELSFDVPVPDPKRGNVLKPYRFNPRLELHADVGRNVGSATGPGAEISYLIFTKSKEKQSIAGKTHVINEEFDAQVQLKVSAKQGPNDPKARFEWMNALRTYYTQRGYKIKVSFRHVNGAMITGSLPDALAGASDLMICTKDVISLQAAREWYTTVNRDVVKQMEALLDKDSLWKGHG